MGSGVPAQAGGEQARSDLAAGLALVEALGAAGAPPRAQGYAGALVEVLFRCALHCSRSQGRAGGMGVRECSMWGVAVPPVTGTRSCQRC